MHMKPRRERQMIDTRRKKNLFLIELTYLSRRDFILVVAVPTYNKRKQKTRPIKHTFLHANERLLMLEQKKK